MRHSITVAAVSVKPLTIGATTILTIPISATVPSNPLRVTAPMSGFRRRWRLLSGRLMAIRTVRFSVIFLPTRRTVRFRVPDAYGEVYRRKEVPGERANFYGMITNIDDNMARLRHHLRVLGLEENTILIFMTDNGSAMGCNLDAQQFVRDGYNAGMRGKKGSPYEGGHRVPLFMHWPQRRVHRKARGS